MAAHAAPSALSSLRWLLVLSGAGTAAACELDHPLPTAVHEATLLGAISALAAAGKCRIVLAPALAQHAATRLRPGTTIAAALDALAANTGLNWRQGDDGVIELLAVEGGSADSQAALVIAADTDRDGQATVPSLLDQARLPSERAAGVARTRIAGDRLDDDALHDYASAVMRAPGVYGMAASDVIRGVSASRLAPNQRASLITIDGVPVPAEAWLFNRPGLGLMQSLEITRGATGLATAYGAGAGDLAIGTRPPAAEFDAGLGLTHASALAPVLQIGATGGLGVAGMSAAFGMCRQLGSEEVAAGGQPDVFRQRQYALQLAWQDPERHHRLQAAAVDFARVDIGGGESPCGGGPPHCLRGEAVAIHGAAAAWQWRPQDHWQLQVQAGSSDTRAAVTRLDTGAIDIADPAFVQLHHLDLRLEFDAGAYGSLSTGLMRAERSYREYGLRRIPITPSTAASLGMLPAAPGPASLRYLGQESRQSLLPQAYLEFFYDDETRWDGHVALRHVAADSRSRLDTELVQTENCALVPGRYDPAIRTCSDALALLVRARNGRVRHHEPLWLPSLGLRRRFGERQWLALRAQESFLASDLDTLTLSPDSALEKLRTLELAWSREARSGAHLETRVFREDWRDRVANFTRPGEPPAIGFDSAILGVEVEWLWQPHGNAELWANASGLHARSTLRPDALAAAAVRGAPEWSAGVGGRMRFAGGGYAGGNFSHAAPTWIVEDDASIERLGARNLLDLRLGWRRGRFDVSIWGTNLLDDHYVADTFGRSIELTPYHAYDRIIGLDLRYGF